LSPVKVGGWGNVKLLQILVNEKLFTVGFLP
jgi:hypothetical protein